MLQSAAVIGKDVPGVLLEADRRSFRKPTSSRSLATLQAAEFLYETRLFPEHEYTFKHALTHEVAYDGRAARAPARPACADRRDH